MEIASQELVIKPVAKNSMKVASQGTATRDAEGCAQTQVQQKAVIRDITQEKWFWENGVMS